MHRLMTIDDQILELGLSQRNILVSFNVFTREIINIHTHYCYNADIEICTTDEISRHATLLGNGWVYQPASHLAWVDIFDKDRFYESKFIAYVAYVDGQSKLLTQYGIYYNPKSCIYKTATLI